MDTFMDTIWWAGCTTFCKGRFELVLRDFGQLHRARGAVAGDSEVGQCRVASRFTTDAIPGFAGSLPVLRHPLENLAQPALGTHQRLAGVG